MRTFRQKIFIGYGVNLILVVLILAWGMFMMLRLGGPPSRFCGRTTGASRPRST